MEQNRSSNSTILGSNLAGSRREDHYPEYRIGRIKHERIKVHRNEELLMENAIKLMQFHASRKSILEIEYYDEEGTGLGPTLEFYALVYYDEIKCNCIFLGSRRISKEIFGIVVVRRFRFLSKRFRIKGIGFRRGD